MYDIMKSQWSSSYCQTYVAYNNVRCMCMKFGFVVALTPESLSTTTATSTNQNTNNASTTTYHSTFKTTSKTEPSKDEEKIEIKVVLKGATLAEQLEKFNNSKSKFLEHLETQMCDFEKYPKCRVVDVRAGSIIVTMEITILKDKVNQTVIDIGYLITDGKFDVKINGTTFKADPTSYKANGQAVSIPPRDTNEDDGDDYVTVAIVVSVILVIGIIIIMAVVVIVLKKNKEKVVLVVSIFIYHFR